MKVSDKFKKEKKPAEIDHKKLGTYCDELYGDAERKEKEKAALKKIEAELKKIELQRQAELKKIELQRQAELKKIELQRQAALAEFEAEKQANLKKIELDEKKALTSISARIYKARSIFSKDAKDGYKARKEHYRNLTIRAKKSLEQEEHLLKGTLQSQLTTIEDTYRTNNTNTNYEFDIAKTEIISREAPKQSKTKKITEKESIRRAHLLVGRLKNLSGNDTFEVLREQLTQTRHDGLLPTLENIERTVEAICYKLENNLMTNPERFRQASRVPLLMLVKLGLLPICRKFY